MIFPTPSRPTRGTEALPLPPDNVVQQPRQGVDLAVEGKNGEYPDEQPRDQPAMAAGPGLSPGVPDIGYDCFKSP